MILPKLLFQEFVVIRCRKKYNLKPLKQLARENNKRNNN